ncbi:MAG: FG-GAP repeat protein, partial [Candidatus Latescibacterota bacterium]
MSWKILWTAAAVCIVISSFTAIALKGLPRLIDLSTPASYTGVLRIHGNYPNGVAGVSVSAGDINGDGNEDVVIGAQRSSPQERNQAGEAYVVFGAERWRNEDIIDLNDPPSGVLRIHGPEAGMEFGRSVAARDMDGDGYDDLIKSAMFASPLARPRAGMLYIMFGSPSLYSAGVIDLKESRPDVIPVYGQDAGEEFGVLIYAGDM